MRSCDIRHSDCNLVADLSTAEAGNEARLPDIHSLTTHVHAKQGCLPYKRPRFAHGDLPSLTYRSPPIIIISGTTIMSDGNNRFNELVQALPPELFRDIHDLTFAASSHAKVEIDNSLLPPSILQVDYASRERAAAAYYSAHVFSGTDYRIVDKWLCSLPQAHRRHLREVRIVHIGGPDDELFDDDEAFAQSTAMMFHLGLQGDCEVAFLKLREVQGDQIREWREPKMNA